MVSFKRPFWERKKESPFSTWGFWCVLTGKGRAGTCLVSAWSPGEVATAAAQLRPQTPSPVTWPEGPDHRPLSGSRPSGAVLRPSGMHCVPRTASSLFWTSPRPASRPPAPSSAPTPVFPVRILPAGWWPGAEWGRPPRQDGYDLGLGNCDLRVLIPRIVVLLCAGSGGLEFGFSFFFPS